MAAAAKEFRVGIRSLHAGVKVFYGTPRFWMYALLPMGIILLLYGAVMALLVFQAAPHLAALLPDPAAWGAWGGWAIHLFRALIYATLILAALVAGVVFLGTFYEALGSVFFDRLIARFEKERYGFEAPAIGWKRNGVLMVQALVFALATLLLSLLCLAPALFIPVAGVLPAMVFVGYRLGFSCLFSSAFARGMGVRELRRLVKGRRAAVFGFGMTGYLYFMIPFAAVFLLPGFLLGGSMLFHEMEKDRKETC